MRGNRLLVWENTFGDLNYSSKCYTCCGATITARQFECGHIIAKANGGLTRLYNLRPICNDCNRSMDTMNMFDYIRHYGFDFNFDVEEAKYKKQLEIYNKNNDNNDSLYLDN